MKRILLTVLALFFPWIVLLIEDNPGGAIVALIMQVTIIGWPFASIWAINSITTKRPKSNEDK